MQKLRLLLISLAVTMGCGGGGAAIDGPANTPVDENPVNPPGTGAPSSPTPATPGSTIVTTAGTSFSPASVTVTRVTVVTWQITGGTHNVTFGSAKPTGGDIPDTGAGRSVARTFATAGTFDYQCTRHSGMTGRVVVSADGTAPAPSNPLPSEGALVQAAPSAFSPERVEIAPGGTVTWEFSQGAGGIAWDEEAPPGGDIPAGAAGTRVSRTFPAQGDYDYHSTVNRDIKGRVRVR
jgi:plastocyanin